MVPQAVEKLILPALLAAPGVTDLVGKQIYAHKLPAGIDLPALTFRRITGIPARHLRGHSTELVKLAVDVWAEDYGQGKVIALEVQRAMFTAPVTNWFEQDSEMGFENYFRITLEYTCQQNGGFER